MHEIIRDLGHQAKNIQWLEFELSNNCQYKNRHPWCPLSKDARPPTFLKSDIVRKVVLFFEKYNFAGRVYFSGYSEPLIDPRLVDLVKFTKSHLPNCNIDMFSNGLACDTNLLKDVLEAGVNRIGLSVYTPYERERFKEVTKHIKKGVYLVERQTGYADTDIDERIKVYDKPIGQRRTMPDEPCFIPTLYYFVRNNGDVNMCFWDWQYTEVFGNLYKDSIVDTLMNERRLQINHSLVNGKRDDIPVCSRCDLPDYRCIREYKDRMVL